MNILHVVPTYYPAVRYGGPIYSVHGLCKALASRGHDVHVVTTSVDGPTDSPVPYDHPVILDGVQVHYAPSRHLRRLYFSPELNRILHSLASRADVFHLHSVFLFPTLAGARLASKTRIPYVLSPRGMLVKELIKQRSTAIKRSWIYFFEYNNLRRAARIHLTSEEERSQLQDLGLALSSTTVIPNGVDEPIGFTSRELSPDIEAIIGEGFDILCFGRISWKKGIDRLIRTLVYAPRVRAIVAGHDEEGLTAKLEEMAVKYNVENRIRFLPRQITGPDKEALFKAARLFVLPSLSENFGNVICEAMIRGLPAVVNARVGAADILKVSGGGVVAEGDETATALLIEQLLGSDSTLAEMGRSGVQFAKNYLTWDRVAASFEHEYCSIRSVLT